MGKSKGQKQQKSQKKVQQYMKKKGYKDKVLIAEQSNKHNKNNTKSPSQHKIQPTSSMSTSSNGKGSKGLSNLQQSFQKKLEGARFRVINERLYTCPGSEAFSEFQKNKSLFKVVSKEEVIVYLISNQ